MNWNKTYGDNVDFGSMIQTPDGGYLIVGDENLFGTHGRDIYLLKTDPSGNMQWNKTYGDTHYEAGFSVVQSPNGGYVIAGSQGSNVFVVKTDLSGNMVWNKTFSPSVGNSVIRSSDGGYAIVGATGFDVYLIKTDSSGNMQWSKTYGGNGTDEGTYVIQTPDGGYAFVGSLSSRVDIDVYFVKTDSYGNMLWNRTYGGNHTSYYGESIVQSSDGGYLIAGYTRSKVVGSNAILYVVKTDSSGNKLWSKTY